MSNNSDIKQHISIIERNRWDKVVYDFGQHLGSGGVDNHRLGDGTVPGFSTNDFTNTEKDKLAGVQDGALNNPHPATHPYTMITGLGTVAHTNQYKDLSDIPKIFEGDCTGNASTVNGIRITIGTSAPANPINDKDIWMDTVNKLVKVYYNNTWNPFRATFD